MLGLVGLMVHSDKPHTVPNVQASKVSGLSPLHTKSPLSCRQWVSTITTIFAVVWRSRNSTARLASTRPPCFFLLIRPVVVPLSVMSRNAIYPMCQYYTMAQGRAPTSSSLLMLLAPISSQRMPANPACVSCQVRAMMRNGGLYL